LERRGVALFAEVCRRDLEGIVANLKLAPYDHTGDISWVKIRNPAYSQMVGRDELFEKREAQALEPWQGCDLLAAELGG
jgi:hypothetical protein